MFLLVFPALLPTVSSHKPPLRAVVEEVVHVLPRGRTEAWDARGKRIPSSEDPLAGQKPSPAKGAEAYRVIIDLRGDFTGVAVGTCTAVTEPHRMSVGLGGSSRSDDKGYREIASITVPKSETAVSISLRFATGDAETCLDKDISELKLTPLQGTFKSNNNAAQGFKVEIPFIDPQKYFGQGMLTFENGAKMPAMPMPEFNGGRLQQRSSIWIIEARERHPTHLKVTRTPWEIVSAGPIPLRPRS